MKNLKSTCKDANRKWQKYWATLCQKQGIGKRFNSKK